MSQENLKLAREVFLAASRGGALDALDQDALERAFEFFHPEIEIREDPRFPEAGVFRGQNAVRRYFAQFTERYAQNPAAVETPGYRWEIRCSSATSGPRS